MTTQTRRNFLRAVSVFGLMAGAVLLKPLRALAAEWPKAAFEAKKLDEAVTAAFGTSATMASAAVRIKAQPQAENGAVVPISVSTDLANVEAIAIFVEKNNSPMIAYATFFGADAFLSARMKMAQSSDVLAVVKAGGKLHSARTNIKVTVGGCG